MGYCFSNNDNFFEGLGYITIHISFLVNPYITTNISVLVGIFILYMASAWVIDGKIYYEGFSMLSFGFILIWRLRIDLKTKRSMFTLK